MKTKKYRAIFIAAALKGEVTFLLKWLLVGAFNWNHSFKSFPTFGNKFTCHTHFIMRILSVLQDCNMSLHGWILLLMEYHFQWIIFLLLLFSLMLERNAQRSSLAEEQHQHKDLNWQSHRDTWLLEQCAMQDGLLCSGHSNVTV